MRAAARVTLALSAVALASTAWAAREWYDYYLQARDHDIPDKRWADCVKNLREAMRLRPSAATNLQTYGLTSSTTCPTTTSGVCLLEQRRTGRRSRPSTSSEQQGAVRKTPLFAELVKRRVQAQAAEAARVTQRARGEVMRKLERAQELGRKGDWEQSLPMLAEAEALAKSLDAETLRSVQREQERQRAAQAEAKDTAARAQRLDQRLSDGDRLLEEGKANEAKLAFDEALDLAPRNARALEGRRLAEDRIMQSTTRAIRLQKLADGKALFDGGQFEAALAPLSDAAADPSNTEAKDLLVRARQILEGLRLQKELRSEIDRRAARAQELMTAGRFPEAQVAYQSVLQLDAQHPHAREQLAEAERRTGEAILARWLPNQQPALALFEPPGGPVLDSPTLSLQGAASDDQGVAKVEFRVGEKLVGEFVPESTPLSPARMVPFAHQLPLEPGENRVVVTAIDTGGLQYSVPFKVERRLRFHETQYFIPAAAASAFGILGVGWAGQRLRRRSARRRRFNPYIAGAPVLDDQMFYGREKLTARMLSTLHRNSLMITGERRIGKTTFLHHLKRVLADRRGRGVALLPGVRRPAGRLRAGLLPGPDRRDDRQPGARPRHARRAALHAAVRRLRRPRLQPRPAAGDRRAQAAHAAQGEARAADRRGGRAQRVLGERQPAAARHLHEELLGEPGGGDERGRHQAALEERGQPLVQLLRRGRAQRLLARRGRSARARAGERHLPLEERRGRARARAVAAAPLPGAEAVRPRAQPDARAGPRHRAAGGRRGRARRGARRGRARPSTRPGLSLGRLWQTRRP